MTILILLAVGMVLGARFTVFALVPLGAVITLSCIVLSLSSQGSGVFFDWATYIAAINIGFLLASTFRNRWKRSTIDHHHYQSRS